MDFYVDLPKAGCNNVTGFMVSAKGHQDSAKMLGEYYGIELIAADDLPNLYQLLTSRPDCTLLGTNAYRYPVLVIMESKNQKNTGSYYPLNHGSSVTITDSTSFGFG